MTAKENRLVALTVLLVFVLGILTGCTVAGVAGHEALREARAELEDSPDTGWRGPRLTEDEAVRLAERVFVEIYGKRVLRQRPWVVTPTTTGFRVVGTLEEGWLGGVAEMEVGLNPDKAGLLITVVHGK